MKVIVVCLVGCMVLSGCSELRVIGKAAMNELAADSISVERERYRPRTEKMTQPGVSRTLVAKASMLEARMEKPAQKELWRNN